MTRRLLAAGALAALLMAACAPANEAATPAAASTGPSDGPALAYSEHDIGFLEDFTYHQEQTLEMAALLPARSEHEELLRYAEDIEGRQTAAIEAMAVHREAAFAERDGGNAHPDHAHKYDAILVSDAEIVELAQSDGGGFERQWIEALIRHHEAAIQMSEEHLVVEGNNDEVVVIAEGVRDAYAAEVEQLRGWLEALPLAG